MYLSGGHVDFQFGCACQTFPQRPDYLQPTDHLKFHFLSNFFLNLVQPSPVSHLPSHPSIKPSIKSSVNPSIKPD